MNPTPHIIHKILPNSIAEELDLEVGDTLISINGNLISDIFDYQYLVQDEYIEVLVRRKNGEEWLLEIDKDYEEDLGIEFENGLMDRYRSCRNKCIFCFIDQMPKGMRETLYFKDDDSRLSFLQGNYVTLTNMSKEDVDRIIRYHLSPINISFQTTNPELRCKILHNKFAGESLKLVDRLYDAGIRMNGQIVLCKGINDGVELERSISDLSHYLPHLESVSVVPVGLTKYRDGLYPLKPFNREDAKEVLSCIHKWQEKLYSIYGLHFVHASDEWYILAGEELPEEQRYDGYLQLENGVGMLRLLLEEFKMAMQELDENRDKERSMEEDAIGLSKRPRTLSLVTGVLAYPYIRRIADQLMERFPFLTIYVYAITNEFFGELITVSGLLTGADIIRQLENKELGERILLPQNVLRNSEDYFLDDVTITEMEKALQVKVDIVKSSGYNLVYTILGEDVPLRN